MADHAGVVVSRLAAPPGGRLVAVAWSGDHAAAVARLGEAELSAGAAITPAPSATRYAMVTGGSLELDSADGKRQWAAVGLRGSPVWLDDYHLVLDMHLGLSRIDVAIGWPSGARCGWGFGLSDTPNLGTPAMASPCTQAALDRGDDFEVPGDAGFKAIVTDVAAASSGSIAEWGSVPIGGATRRFAVIVVSQGQMDMTTLVGYLIEVSPGSYVEAIFHGWGFVQPNYEGLAHTPVWTVGATATAAREDHWGNRISKYHDNGFSFETRWIHMSGEQFNFTVRNGTFVVTSLARLELTTPVAPGASPGPHRVHRVRWQQPSWVHKTACAGPRSSARKLSGSCARFDGSSSTITPRQLDAPQ